MNVFKDRGSLRGIARTLVSFALSCSLCFSLTPAMAWADEATSSAPVAAAAQEVVAEPAPDPAAPVVVAPVEQPVEAPVEPTPEVGAPSASVPETPHQSAQDQAAYDEVEKQFADAVAQLEEEKGKDDVDLSALEQAVLVADQGALQALALSEVSGYCSIYFRNYGMSDYVFGITMPDGSFHVGYCLDHMLPAPADGTYTFSGTWDAADGEYNIVVNTRNATVHWSQVDLGVGCQRVGNFSWKPKSKFKLTKASSAPAMTEGNPLYSFEGTEYGLYFYRADAVAMREPDYRIRVNADGSSDVIEGLVPDDRWYVRELKAGRGYRLDPGIYPVAIKGTGITEFTAVDEPIDDPEGVLLHKVNAAGETVRTGDGTLAGAKYAFDYYAGYYYSESELPSTPTRHWVLQTNNRGYVGLTNVTSSDYSYVIDAGEGFYYDAEGYATCPLGTIAVREVSAPNGFEKSDEVFISRYVQDPSMPLGGRWEGASSVNQGNLGMTAEEQPKLYGISLFKTVQGVENEISPEGIQFEIALQSTGEVYEVLTIGADGTASTEKDALPWGVYEVREVAETVPEGIQPYRATSNGGTDVVAVVDFTQDDMAPLNIAPVMCVDYPTASIGLDKRDADTLEPISNVEFTLYRYTGDMGMDEGAIAADPAELDPHGAYWERIGALRTDAHGVATFANLNFGIYMMAETEAEYRYLTLSESLAGGLDADPLDTARLVKVDKNTPAEVQLWEDEAIRIECTVDKSTIQVTSAGFEYDTSSEGGQHVSNVGVEEYRYDVDFSNGATNTYADEFWMVDQLNMVESPYDLRVTTMVLPAVVHDAVPTVQLLIKTNGTAGSSWAPVVETGSHRGTLCDGSSRFEGAGWRYVGTYDSGSAVTIDVASMLAEGEYLTGVCLYYGAVEQGFCTVSSLSYMVQATHSLVGGMVIPNTAESHITRNWAVRQGSTGGLRDDAIDSVQTTVIATFVQHFDKFIHGFEGGSLGSWMPQTGDNWGGVAFALVGLMISSGVVLVLSRRRDTAKKGEADNGN